MIMSHHRHTPKKLPLILPFAGIENKLNKENTKEAEKNHLLKLTHMMTQQTIAISTNKL